MTPLLPHDHDDATHVACCDDTDIALCRYDLADVPWTDTPATCAPCAHLEGSGYCPKNLRCRIPENELAYSNPAAVPGGASPVEAFR